MSAMVKVKLGSLLWKRSLSASTGKCFSSTDLSHEHFLVRVLYIRALCKYLIQCLYLLM